MTTLEIFQLLIGSGGLLGIGVLVFRTRRMAEKIDNIQKDNTEIKREIREMNLEIQIIKVQIAKLETRVEERTLRVHYDSTKEYAVSER